jgi:hypothetical protein
MTTDTLTYDPCDQCGSPLDQQQRYCVVCGAHRHHPADPVGRYLATAMRPRSAQDSPPPATARRTDGRWTAAAFALLPVVAAIGVLVGRGSANNSADLVAALKAQKAPVVQVGTAGGGGTGAAATGTTAKASASAATKAKRAAQSDTNAAAAKKPTAEQKQQGAKIVKQIQGSKGKSYVDQQRRLPDTIVVP